MRYTLPFLLLSLAACASQTTSLQVPDEVGDIDWQALSFATATVYDSGETSGGMQIIGATVAISDRDDLCDFTGPEGAVDSGVDVHVVQVSMRTTELEPRRYVATTRTGPGMVDGPSDVAMGALVTHQHEGEQLVRASSGTSPKASLTIDELSDNLAPISGSFSFRLVKDRGTAQPADFDENEDGRLDYRKLDALVKGTFVDAEWCAP